MWCARPDCSTWPRYEQKNELLADAAAVVERFGRNWAPVLAAFTWPGAQQPRGTPKPKGQTVETRVAPQLARGSFNSSPITQIMSNQSEPVREETMHHLSNPSLTNESALCTNTR